MTLPVQLVTSTWGSSVEIETRRRILVSCWAYAYEKLNLSLVPDDKFDLESALIDVSIDTTRPHMDAFFREHFSPETGMWINQHPELELLHKFGKRMGLWK